MINSPSVYETERRESERRIARTSPADFADLVTAGQWQMARHLKAANAIINQGLLTGSPNRIMLTMPPQHGKSELGSHYVPAQFLGTHPGSKVIITSFEADFAAMWSGMVRDTLIEWGWLFDVKVKGGSNAPRAGWSLEKPHGGYLIARGAGGGITGRGANLLVIDDPIKNQEQAYSEVWRKKIWDWYRSTAYTRLRPNAVVILIQTRWHQDDLAGRILKHQPDKWTVIDFPAIAEHHDELGREPGDPLWPEMFDADDLADKKETIGGYWWNALYMQRPTSPEGAIFRRSRFRYFSVDDSEQTVTLHHEGGGNQTWKWSDLAWFQAADTALTKKDTSAYTVIITIGKTPTGELLIFDLDRERLEVPDQEPRLLAAYQRFRPRKFGIEEKASGIGLIQGLRRKNVRVIALKADTDKITRAQPVSLAYEQGRVYHRLDTDWLEAFEDELVNFPVGTHDDQVDALSHGHGLAAGPVGPVHPSTVARRKKAQGRDLGPPKELVRNQRKAERGMRRGRRDRNGS